MRVPYRPRLAYTTTGNRLWPPADHRLVVALLLLAVGCEGSEDTATSAPCTVEAALMEANPFGVLVTAECTREVELQVFYGDAEDVDGVLPFQDGIVGENEIFVLGLHAESTISVLVDAVEDGRVWPLDPMEVVTPPLPPEWQGCSTVAFSDGSTWDTYEATCFPGGLDPAHQAMLCFDRSGLPIWAFSSPEVPDPTVLCPLADGSLILSTGKSNLLLHIDKAGRILSTLQSFDLSGTRYSHQYIDGHDVIQITEGPWAGAIAFLTYSFETMLDGDNEIGTGIVVLNPDTHDVLWDWSILGDPDDGVPIDPSIVCEKPISCLKVNALLHGVDVHGDEFFWIERNMVGQILRVNVQNGEITWKLGANGDFRLVDDLDTSNPEELTGDQWMANPHGPKFLERSGSRTRFLVHDNGRPAEGGEKVFSRVLEYEIDEVTHLATVRFSYGGMGADPDVRWYAPSNGDVEVLRDGDGFLFLKGTRDVFVSDVSLPQGEERWRLTCPGWDEAYNMAWFPSLYDTTWAYGEP
jgi:hypothetical protein